MKIIADIKKTYIAKTEYIFKGRTSSPISFENIADNFKIVFESNYELKFYRYYLINHFTYFSNKIKFYYYLFN